MQRITVAEIKPPAEKGKPTIITDDKGAKFSGFGATLAVLKKGDVIEAEVEIDGKFHNIKSHSVIVSSPAAPPIPVETVNLLEVQSRLEMVTLEAITRLLTTPIEDRWEMPDDIFKGYCNRLRLHLHVPPVLEERKAPERAVEKNIEPPPEKSAGLPRFENIGAFLTACSKINGADGKALTKTGVLKLLNRESLEGVDLAEAYETIRKARS